MCSESRACNDGVFTKDSKLFEALAFLASPGPLDVTVLGQGLDGLTTDLESFSKLGEIPDITWTFEMAISWDHATKYLRPHNCHFRLDTTVPGSVSNCRI
jgi:hypothetical protein